MKLLFVGDVHLSDRPPSTRREGYSVEILTKLTEVGLIAKEEGASAILYAGDIFHSKIPHRTSHELVQQAMRVFAEQTNPIVVPGNHDYAGANVEELRRSPLGTVAQGGAVRLLGVEHRSLRLPPPPSWVTVFGIREEEPIETFGDLELGVGANVVVAHSAIFPPDQEPPFAHFRSMDVAEVVSGVEGVIAAEPVKWVLYGHIHDPHGIYEIGDVTFVNPGSLSRGSLWEADPQRVPQVALIDTVRGEARLIPLERSVLPWTEVFRITEEHEKRDRSLAAADFAAELVSASVAVFDVERVIESLRRRDDVSERVVDRAVQLVESVTG